MANTKITELTAVTALAGTDVFPVVDVSASTTNKVSVEDLLRNAPDGSAGAPSIANAGDQDTGIFFPADNSVGVSTDGTQRLVIDSSGRVGIGTTSPENNLHIADTSGPIIRLTNSTGTDGTYTGRISTGDAAGTFFAGINFFKHDTNDGEIRFRTKVAGSNQDTVTIVDGNVGIGTTSPATNLHIIGSGDTIARVTSADGSGAFLDLGDASDPDGGRIVYDSGSNLTFSTASTERLRINSSGNVGIGTTSPLTKIDSLVNTFNDDSTKIAASFRNNQTSGVYAVWQNTTTGTAFSDGLHIGLTNISDGLVALKENKSLKFEVNGSERLRIDSVGRVGIGTTAPGYELDVTGSIKVSSQGRFGNGSASTPSYAFDSDHDTGMYRATTNALGFATSGSERLRIDSSGNVGIGDTSPSAKLEIRGASTVGTNSGHIVLSGDSATVGQGPQIVFSESGSGSSVAGAYIGHGREGSNSIGFLSFGTRSSSDANDTPAERMRLTSNGNLGLGSSSPGAKLTIAGGTANNYTDGILLSKSGGNAYGIYPSTNNLEFRSVTGSNHIATFDYNGKVGIGTTSPSQALDVVTSSGNAYIRAARNSQSTGQVALNLAGGTSGVDWILYQPTSSNDFRIFGNSSDRLTVTSAGNVGIGTTSPSTRFHLTGTDDNFITLDHATRTGSWIIKHSGSNSENLDFRQNNGSTTVRSYLAGRDLHEFHTSGSERMRIDSNGRVMIGTTTNNGGALTVDSGGSANVVLRDNGIENHKHNANSSIAINYNGYANGTTQFRDLAIYNGKQQHIATFDGSTSRLGIGTSSPAEKLHVAGKLLLNNGSASYFDAASSGGLNITNSTAVRFEVGSERLRIDSSGRLLVGQTSTSAASTLLLENNSLGTSRQGILLLARGEATPDDGDALGTFVFTAGNHDPAVEINARRDGGTWTAGSSQPTRLEFSTTDDSESSPTERMRIGRSGQFSLYSEGALARTSVVNSGTSASSAAFDIRNNATSTITGTQVFAIRENGDIYTSGNTTVQSLSSERRLKENIEVIDPAAAWTTIKNTPYYSYNYIGQEGPRYGPIVDEVPADMVRDTDLSDDQGPIRTFDNGMLHARLYSALQQAIAKIETLEAKVAALEAQ